MTDPTVTHNSCLRCDLRSEKNIGEWLNLFSSCSQDRYGKLSCVLAEDYWNGRFSQDDVLSLLNLHCKRAKLAASWVISDRGILNDASRALMIAGLNSVHHKVKGHAISFVNRCKGLPPMEKQAYLSLLLKNDHLQIQERAKEIFAERGPAQREEAPEP